MEIAEICETVKAAEDYLKALKELENQAKIAEEQIENSAESAEKSIKQSFSNLYGEIKKVLNDREQSLLEQITKVKQKSLNPLRECEKVIITRIDNTECFIRSTTDAIRGDKKLDGAVFDGNTSKLGSLPEVPQLKDVPCISYDFDGRSYEEIIALCKSFGLVCSIAPVQISSITEKPGSVLVEFETIEQEDKLTDIQEFRLQKAVKNADCIDYQDCYIGGEPQYLVRDLQINQSYLFRSCCKFEGCPAWSSWSIPQIGKTTIKPYNWRNNNNYTFRDDNRIASPVKNDSGILFSDGAQLKVGYSIEFTFLECDIELSGTFIGLSLDDSLDEKTLMTDSFLIEATGDVYVSGIKKSTRLPGMNTGSKICFTCELLNESKIMMNLECGGKQVTYDWLLNADDEMYFLASFNSTKWKVLVE